MLDPRNRLRGLYAITDETLIPEAQFHHIIKQALQGGAGIIQYRDKSGNFEKQKKQASTLRALCNQYDALLLINDDLELAQLVNADGIHLGENDASISEARKLYQNEQPFSIELDNAVYALDSSTIDLCLSLFPWAKFRTTKGAVKIHTLLDIRGSIPSCIIITDGSVHS